MKWWGMPSGLIKSLRDRSSFLSARWGTGGEVYYFPTSSTPHAAAGAAGTK